MGYILFLRQEKRSINAKSTLNRQPSVMLNREQSKIRFKIGSIYRN